MRVSRWLAILSPALLGLTINLLVYFTGLPNPNVVFTIALSQVIFWLGALFSLLAAGGLIFWERTERLRLQAALESAAERRRFLQRLDHELKNPLTAILVGLANLKAISEEETQQVTLASVDSQVQRLRRLVGDLRKLSDLETRKLEREPVPIGELLEEVYAVTQERFASEARALNLSIPQAPWPLPHVLGDRDLLFLAIHNLVDNAVKFSQPGDTLEIRGFEDNAQVVVEVADTGPGIPAEEMDHVWEELYRGEGARGITGSGLGLALVRAIVARHGGEASLRSRSGQGTVFTLRLPVETG